jgi:ferritin-like metal-binding protein YciE
MKPLEKLFWEELGEMIHIEDMLLKALPKMRDSVEAEPLKEALEAYREECEKQVEMVREIFSTHSLPAREKKCEAMMGVLTRGQQFMIRSKKGPTLDAALLSIVFKVFGYKLASYRCLVAWASAMDAAKVSNLLRTAVTGEERSATGFRPFADKGHNIAASEESDEIRSASRKVRRQPVPTA